MRNISIGLITLAMVACDPSFTDDQGRRVYRPSVVATDWQEDYATLAGQVNELAGYEILGYGDDESPVQIVSDAEAIAANRRRPGHEHAAAYTEGLVITLPPAYDTYKGWRAIILAHEIGHEFGLHHTDGKAGLMAAILDKSVIGHEAEALLEALREGGVL